MSVCKICGLPEEVCVCNELNTGKKIKSAEIRVVGKRRKKTVIEGLSNKALASELQKVCCCGGTCKDGKTILQGNQKAKAVKLLQSLGFLVI